MSRWVCPISFKLAIHAGGLASYPRRSPEPGEEGAKEPNLMRRVYRRPAARRDLIAHYCYLSETGGEVIADRFLSQVEASFDDLLEQPAIGALDIAPPGASRLAQVARKGLR
jgi:plasmid stabilization system protein ParE